VAENKKSSIGGKSTCHLLNIKQPSRVAKRLKLSFRRTKAMLNVLKTGKTLEASIGLIDVSDTGAGFFTEELLVKGSTVEICLPEPRLLKVKGVIAWSVPARSCLHGGKFCFRSGMQFVFENELQRTAVIEFIQAVNTDPLDNIHSAVETAPAPAAGLAPGAGGGPNVAFMDKAQEGAPPEGGAPAAGEAPEAEPKAEAEAPAAAEGAAEEPKAA
jgi:hypothetical protein